MKSFASASLSCLLVASVLTFTGCNSNSGAQDKMGGMQSHAEDKTMNDAMMSDRMGSEKMDSDHMSDDKMSDDKMDSGRMEQ